MDTKDKLSRALGTAYLSHQVAQLEQNIWKNNVNHQQPRSDVRGRGSSRGGRGASRGGRIGNPRRLLATASPGNDDRDKPDGIRSITKSSSPVEASPDKTADRIVVDASVLIHALGTVRSWCHELCTVVVIIPLEALNTLDLLKKGSSRTAIQARNASRLLEAQVGVNRRILVQQDHGYIPWEEVFSEDGKSRTGTTRSGEDDNPQPSPQNLGESAPLTPSSTTKRVGDPPEWLKRTVCCAKFEQRRPPDGLDKEASHESIKTVLAITPISIGTREIQENRYSERASGVLTRQWAINAGLDVLEIDEEFPSEIKTKKAQREPRLKRIDDSDNESNVGSAEDPDLHQSEMVPWGDGVPAMGSSPPASSRQSGLHNRTRSGEASFSPRPRAMEPPSPRRAIQEHAPGGYKGRRHTGSLVEKPSAPIALTNAGLLPAGKTIRLLTRGEKLEP